MKKKGRIVFKYVHINVSSLIYILKLNHGFALLKAVQTNHTQYRIDKYTCCKYSLILRCLDNCEIKQNTACRTNELHIVYTMRRVLSLFRDNLGTILVIRSLFVSLTNLWVVVSMDCCRLTAADSGVLNIPIKTCASTTRKSSCLYFFFGKRTDPFIMRKASMMAVLIKKDNTYFHHFLLRRPTKYIKQNWTKMSTPPKKDCMVLTDTLRSGNRHYNPIFQAPGYVWAHENRWRCGWRNCNRSTVYPDCSRHFAILSKLNSNKYISYCIFFTC